MNFGEELRENYNLNESGVDSSSSDESDDGEISAESKVGDHDGGIHATLTVSSTFLSNDLMQSASAAEYNAAGEAAALTAPVATGPTVPASKNSNFKSGFDLGPNGAVNSKQSDSKTSEQTSLKRSRSIPESQRGSNLDVNVETNALALNLSPVKNTALSKSKLTPTETKELWPEDNFGSNLDSEAPLRKPTNDASRIKKSSTVRDAPVEIPIRYVETTDKIEVEASRGDSEDTTSEVVPAVGNETAGKEHFGSESTNKVTSGPPSHLTSAIDAKDSALCASVSKDYQNCDIISEIHDNGHRNEEVITITSASPSTTKNKEAHIVSSSTDRISKFRQRWDQHKMTEKVPQQLSLKSAVPAGRAVDLQNFQDSFHLHPSCSSNRNVEAKVSSAELSITRGNTNPYPIVFKSNTVPSIQIEDICQLKNDESKRWAERITPSFRKTSNVQESLVTAIRSSPSPNSFPSREETDMYHIFMADKICSLRLQNFGKNVHKELEEDFKNTNGVILSLVSAETRGNFDRLLHFVEESVMKAERLFEEEICFPIRIELDKELRTIFEIPPALITALPDNLISVLRACIQDCRDEYRQRNRRIVELEEEVLNLVLEQAVVFYQEELEYRIIECPGDQCQSQYDFVANEPAVRQLTEDSFFEACGSGAWKQKYSDRLADKLSPVRKKMEELHRAKETLSLCRHESVRIYKNAMDEMHIGPISERLTSFSNCDRAAREQAISAYKTSVDELKASAVPENMFAANENELQELLNKAYSERRRVLVNEENAVKAKEAERVRIEEIQRKRKESEERCKRDLERREAERKAKENEESNKLKQKRKSFIDANKEAAAITDAEQSEQQLRSEPCGEKGNEASERTSTLAKELSLMTAPRITISSAELAIHIGLHRTRVGFITPTTGQICTVAKVDNCMYVKNFRLGIAFSHDEVKQLGKPAVDFRGSILHDSTDKLHSVWLNNGRQSYLRLQEILARFFLCLRHKAEIVLKTHFPKCVIAVPQCLNDMQRCCIEDGAVMSGFDGIQLVNDTNAVAVTFVVDTPTKFGNIVVVNGSEETFDIASFQFNNGMLQCHGVTGHYFDTNSDRSNLKKAIHSLTKHFENPVKKYFDVKQLGVSPTSPNTTYLILNGHHEGLENYKRAAYTAIGGRKDGIKYMDVHAIVKGAAYLCCLRSRDLCNAILHLWKEKLQASRKSGIENLLRELEEKIISQERRIVKKSKIPLRGGALNTNEMRNMRKSLSLELEYDITLHATKLAVLNLMAAVETYLPKWQHNKLCMDYESRLKIFHEQLIKDDPTGEDLEEWKNELTSMLDFTVST